MAPVSFRPRRVQGAVMKTCETCKWELNGQCYRAWGAALVEHVRADNELCGPTGRYWEPREEEE